MNKWPFLLLYVSSLHALPEGPQVRSGTVNISQTALKQEILTSQTAVIDWNSFSISQGEAVRFIQPNHHAKAINRVVGSSLSKIGGLLEGNGAIYLINPQGIILDSTGSILCRSFLASTLDAKNIDLIERQNFLFEGLSTNPIEIYGEINAKQIALLSHKIANFGKLTAPEGCVWMISGDKIAFKQNPESSIFIEIDLLKSASVEISESNGKVFLINQEGSIRANCIHLASEEGFVCQVGDLDGNIDIYSPRVQLSGAMTGDSIRVSAQDKLVETATSHQVANDIRINAGRIFSSGVLDAPSIQLDGNEIILAGANFSAPSGMIGITANEITVTPATNLTANGILNGDGGSILLWSEQKTSMRGSLSANGGMHHGNGGKIEVSSAGQVFCDGQIETKAPHGTPGTFTLDPQNLVIDNATAIYPQYQFIDPNYGDGSGFGSDIIILSTGNVVISKYDDNFNASGSGVVYLYNGTTGSLISALRGSNANDFVGSSGSTALELNGNFVTSSPQWSNGANASAGAVTWGSGINGINGVVSTSNSLVGSSAIDIVGAGGIFPLTNGNFAVISPYWDLTPGGGEGAVFIGNGSNGQFAAGGWGPVSSSNSLVGGVGDNIGEIGGFSLSNGNFVFLTFDFGPLNTGAATWINGITGTDGLGNYGTVSASNSIVGSTNGDFTSPGRFPLTNGNYVITVPRWNNGGSVSQAGAAFCCDGNSGAFLTGGYGAINSSNSLVGTNINNRVGNLGVLVLTNGNYVVISSDWSSLTGAATWGRGTAPATVGNVSALNSIVGSAPNDFLGAGVNLSLTNGNFVISSTETDIGGAANTGAVTLGNGTNGQFVIGGGFGAISTVNSVYSNGMNDRIGNSGLFEVANSNFVITSGSWSSARGAATWCNGTTGEIQGGGNGPISAANSLVGTNINDLVSSSGVTVLTNGNYVASSTVWTAGGNFRRGASTWGNGNSGFPTLGQISSLNSFLGVGVEDQLGLITIALTNGNYVLGSPLWNGDIGAVSWGNGTTGLTGTISAMNSITGSLPGDLVSSGSIYPLSNGNFAILSTSWNGDFGAVTVGNGSNGELLTGGIAPISTTNSITGAALDFIGDAGLYTLGTGDFVFASSSAFGGLGAVTWVSETTGQTILGSISPINMQNSFFGPGASLDNIVNDNASGTFLMLYSSQNSGEVYAGMSNPNQLTYSRAESFSITLASEFITAILNQGQNAELFASNDITINSPIAVSAGGNGGDLTLSAGNNLFVNANITSDNGSINLIANDLAANGVIDLYRLPGSATLDVASGVMIDAGTGNIVLELRNGQGKTYSESGNVTIHDNASVLGNSVSLLAQEHDITLGDGVLIQGDTLVQLTAGVSIASSFAPTLYGRGSGELILISDNLFPSPPQFGNGGLQLPNATLITDGGRLLLYSVLPALNTLPPMINGIAFIPDPLFVNSITEKYGTYYPNSSGIPFTVFYKIGAQQQITTLTHDIREYQVALTESISKWSRYYLGGYLGENHYAPYQTYKPYFQLIPKLVVESRL